MVVVVVNPNTGTEFPAFGPGLAVIKIEFFEQTDDTSDKEAKALELVAEAEKKLNSSKSFLGGLFG